MKNVTYNLMTKKGVHGYLYRYFNSSNRFEGFLDIEEKLLGQFYWIGLRAAYQDSDNLYWCRQEVKEAFQKEKSAKHALMKSRELKYLENLPAKFKIYRGMTVEEYESGDFGVSWSLKKKVANFFANQYNRNRYTAGKLRMVHEIQISKEDVICFWDDRKEFEIIYLHSNN